MNPKSPTEFQNGIIDIFRQNKTLDLNIVDCEKKGNVLCEMVRKKAYNYIIKFFNLEQ